MTTKNQILVDGYNVIHAIPHLKTCLSQSLEFAREELLGELIQYSDFEGCEVIVVFDSSKPRPSQESLYSKSGFQVVYTSHRQTADAFIERFIYQHKDPNIRLRVVSGDRKIQDIALGKNVAIATPEAFYQENW